MMDMTAIDRKFDELRVSARIPGAAFALVMGDETYVKGFGLRDVERKLPMTAETLYPIASTTKAINATLLALLIEDGLLAWDVPIREYGAKISFLDPVVAQLATLRDLVSMRTGLPRHDWVWLGNPAPREEVVGRLAHLPSSASFRERFQYNNLTVTAAAAIAEHVTGQLWEDLILSRLLTPLQMSATGFRRPDDGSDTQSYFETADRALVQTRRVSTDSTGPSGGNIHSNMFDMAKWLAFNLDGGCSGGQRLIRTEALTELFTPVIPMGTDPVSPSPNACYGLGWFIDTYYGHDRLSHTGYLHDVNSVVLFFPNSRIGIAVATNFGSPRVARQLGEELSAEFLGLGSNDEVSKKLAKYEKEISDNIKRIQSLSRVYNTEPSHPISDHVGAYEAAGYGLIEIVLADDHLELVFNEFHFSLMHRHYDCWVFDSHETFSVHLPHPFDTASTIMFATDSDGKIHSLTIALEPSVEPICFERLLDTAP